MSNETDRKSFWDLCCCCHCCRPCDRSVEITQSNVPQSEEEEPLLDSDSPNIIDENKLHRKGNDPAGKERESYQRKNVPAMEHYSSSLGVKVQVLVAGETFQTHKTFIQKLKLQRELRSAEKCDVILLFCAVVSRIGTDMEAAMKGVPENKPVILMFMHHCHDPSNMTNITVQPCRSNIVQVVHCAFHEYEGLLECQVNKEAVTKVLVTLKKYK